jgi:hypothetical protein
MEGHQLGKLCSYFLAWSVERTFPNNCLLFKFNISILGMLTGP